MTALKSIAALAPSESASGGQFNLLRWFSGVSFLIIGSVAIGLGLVSTRYLVNESVERDALLSAQFIHAIAAAEIRHVDLPPSHVMGDVLDTRKFSMFAGDVADAQLWARGEFLDHIAHLPDALLTNIYGTDRVIIWSSNPELMGRKIEGNADLERAFGSQQPVTTSYYEVDESRSEQKFTRQPQHLFIENYIPLYNASGNEVAAMVEIYKEPRDLVERIERGYQTIWVSTAIGGLLIYLGLFWIVRRASRLLAAQQRQLITNETYVLLGEMSSAVAHSLRNPLAAIRSSAELAQEVAGEPAQRNIIDIIDQVDRMSRWVRDLLQSSRPLGEESEPVDLASCVREALQAFETQMTQRGIALVLEVPTLAPLLSRRVLLLQVLHSLLANALEAMPLGGTLTLRAESIKDGRNVQLDIRDTGKGMSAQQQAAAFKPFFTTKQGGLGVGLMLVKRIMERFGGSVGLTSREQEGTCISLGFRVAGGEYGTEHPGR